MQLRLKALAAYANESPAPTEALFGADGGTMGRDPRCHMVLIDPLRRISRIQGQILWESGEFHLINASTSNPIYVNGRELGPGARSVISAREEWRTGNYLITVEQESGSQPASQSTPTAAPRPVDAQPMPAAIVPTVPSSVPVAPAMAPTTAVAVPLDSAHPASGIKGPFDDLLETPVNPDGCDLSAPLLAPEPLRTDPAHAQLPADPFALAPAPAPTARSSHASRHVSRDQLSMGDPFADLMGAPIDTHLSSAPARDSFDSGRPTHQTYTPFAIPDDFNPMMLGGVAHRNNDDPLQALLEPGHVKDMFPERSLDAIFQPTDGSIDSMTTDPIQAAHHQAFMDASTRVDPLAIFSEQRTEDSLNPEFFQSIGTGAQKTHSDHTSELGSYFRAPRAMDAPQWPQSQNQVAIPDVDLSFFTPASPPIPQSPDSVAAPPLSATQGIPISQPEMASPTQLTTAAPPPPPSTSLPPSTPSSQAVDLNSLFDLSGPSDGLVDWSASQPPDASPMHQEPTAPPANIVQPVAPPTALFSDMHASPDMAPAQPVVDQRSASSTSHPAPSPMPAQMSDGDNAQQLLEAFKRGAGLNDCRYPQQLTPELMHMIGQMLSASVQGCMDLLSSRAAAKQEVRIAVTLINAEANNPLKFLPTGAAALAQILGPKMPGFLSGPAAIENAHLDLRAHEVGMMAGTQAAVQGLFTRFDPEAIEQQLDAQGKQRTFFSSQRNARLWEMYCSHYKWLKEEMKNQTPASWGREFHNAYHTEMSSMDNKGGTTQ